MSTPNAFVVTEQPPNEAVPTGRQSGDRYAVSTGGYRPDIDGLRAFAVLLVLLFHAELGVPGGFVGVDVFFVISGYLITGLILRDLAAGTFSLADFWARRIRRIAPAALFMTSVVLLVGAVLLFPADFEELGESAIAHPLMVSNFYFWKKTGYFDGPADLKPLLHTWSLSVEEQFYILYPMILMLLGRSPRRVMIAALSLLAAASFLMSVRGVQLTPGAAFFLLPSRAWELLLGGLICFLPHPERLPRGWIQLLGLVGSCTILTATALYTSSTPFPGVAAVLPCLGTAVLLYANGHQRSWIGRGLAWKPFVQVGLLSYSLYLWHWPIVVFLRNQLGEDFRLGPRLFAVAASFLAAYLSWRFVETPLRHGTVGYRRRTVFAAATCACTLLIAVGWCVQESKGLPQRFSPELQRLLASMKAPRFQKFVLLADVTGNRLPEFGDRSGKRKCLIWGDSHAMALIPALDETCRELGVRGFQATYGATLPLMDFRSARDGSAPEQYDEAVLNRILAAEFDIVILAGYWSRDSDNPDFLPSLQETITLLSSTGVRVVIMRDVPTQAGNASSLIAAPLRRGTDLEEVGVTLEQHRRRQQAADDALADLATGSVSVVDPAPFLIDETKRCRIVMNGECLYSDEHHLSVAGARRLKPLFAEILTPLRAPAAAGKTAAATDAP